MTIRFKITGLDRVNDAFERMKREVPDAVAQAIEYRAGEIMNASEEECPWHTGALRRSRTKPSDMRCLVTGVYLELHFGYNMEYALVVHENLESDHSYHPGTKAKYLIDPYNEQIPFLKTDINDYVNECLAGIRA